MRRGHKSEADGAVRVEPNPDGTMEVKLTGTPEKIREQMGITSDDSGDSRVEEESGDMWKILNDPQNIVLVKRVAPRDWNGIRCNVEVWRENCPMTMQDIEDELLQNHGGKKYRMSVVSQVTGETLAAKRIDIDMDPIVKPVEIPDGGEYLFGEGGPPPSAGQMTEETLTRQASITAKQIEFETLSQQLQDIKARNKPDAHQNGNNNRIADLERKVADSKYEIQIEALKAKIELLSKQGAAPPPGQGSSDKMLDLILDQQKRSDARFDKLIDQMKENQLGQLRQDIAELKNAPKQEGNTLRENIETMKSLADIIGWKTGGGNDDDEGGEDDPWYVRLGEKYLPKVFDLIEERKEQGKPMSKEEIVAQINASADVAMKEESEKIRQAMLVQQARLAQIPQPALTGSTTASPAAPATGTATAPALKLVPPVAPEAPTVEQEIQLRAASAIAVLERESTLRPRDQEWPYVFWKALPEALLEKVIAAVDVSAMLTVFAEIVNPEGVKMMLDRVASEPKVGVWIKRGHDELKKWSAALAADPNFDPEDEGEEADE